MQRRRASFQNFISNIAVKQLQEEGKSRMMRTQITTSRTLVPLCLLALGLASSAFAQGTPNTLPLTVPHIPVFVPQPGQVQNPFKDIDTSRLHRNAPRTGVWRLMRGHRSMLVEVKVDSALHGQRLMHPELRTAPELKMEFSLLPVIDQIAIDGSFSANAAKPNFGGSRVQVRSLLQIDDSDRVLCYLRPPGGVTLADLQKAVVRGGGVIDLASDVADKIEAWIPVLKMKQIAALPQVGSIRHVPEAHANTGSVTSRGDTLLRSYVGRGILSTAGAGVKVGVMSTDCSSGPGGLLAVSKSTGDINSSFVSLSDPDSLTQNHEGLAMSEIVQDIAPAAQIYFITGLAFGDLGFAQNMEALATAGCTVICDDISYFDEPYFQDGITSHVLDSLSAAGVVCASSSGNFNESGWVGTYSNMTGTGPLAGKNVCDFGGGNPYLPIQSVAGMSIPVYMQWNDPFPGSFNDYNIYLIDPTKTSVINGSNSVQNSASSDPIEAFAYSSTSTSNVYYLAIERKTVSGTDPNATATLQIVAYGDGASLVNGGAAAPTTAGHACADSCLGVGAVDAKSTNYNVIEWYSSQGPAYRYTYGTGTRTLRATLQKPDISAFDDVNTTVSGFAPFQGTSAASPHVAGVAALLFSANPSVTATQVRAALRSGTVDEGTTGFDYAFGSGRLDAFKAITESLSGTGKSFAAFQTVNTAIPDNNVSGISSTIPTTLNANADSVYLSFTIDGHPHWGDLVVTLTSPDATTRTVLTKPPTGAGTSNGNYPNVILGDQAPTALESYDPGANNVIGFYVPQNTISTAAGFHGRAISGNWTINVADEQTGNTGTLKDWGIYWKVLPNANESLTLSGTPPYIWSSDNSLKTVTVNQTVNNGALPVIKLNSVTANETVAGGDIVAATGVNTTSLQLRAQCDANIGRVYTASYELTDIGGYDSVFKLYIPVLRQIGHISAFPITSSGGTSLGLPSVNPLVSGTTTFTYTLSAAESVYLNIFDLHGKWLKSVDNGAKTIGPHTKSWDGTSANGTLLPDGTYIYQLDAGGSFFDGTVTLNH
jgi:subtilisin-like proprotein convertase family protein